LDGEGVNTVEGFEVVEVRKQDVRGESARYVDEDLSRILEEAALAHAGQEAKCNILGS
jgi:hypothetical protein